MKTVKIDLWIDGIISAESYKLVAKGLKRIYDENSCLCLFCGYSNYEILIGTEFDCLVNLQTKKEKAIKATLIDVTQQVSLPFDNIPFGWRVIARFMFSKEDLNFIKSEMSIIDSWSQSKNHFKLIAYNNE